jgi:chemotaxis protein CheD
VFGGSALFQHRDRYAASLGAKNVSAALQLLENAGIAVVAQETGGDQGRKVVFDTDDGVAWSRRV